MVDTKGPSLQVVVHSTGIQDRDGAALCPRQSQGRFPWLELIWAAGDYNAHQDKDTVSG
jgi:hypothetical protein